MNGNISADPLFANPIQGDYHLQQGSPSIDAGINEAPNLLDTDIDGDTRILDGNGDGTATIDMGIDEFLVAPSIGIGLQKENNGNLLKINSTNGQRLFTRHRRQELERRYQVLYRPIGAPIFRLFQR